MSRDSDAFEAGRDARTPRRLLLKAGAGIAAVALVRRVPAAPDTLAQAIAAFTGGAIATAGGVRLDVARLVDNGNTVPITVGVEDAPGRVEVIAVFNERNPERDVVRFTFGPRASRPRASTRVRLATSQKLVAVARFADGTFRSDTVDVVVTLAACIEGEAS